MICSRKCHAFGKELRFKDGEDSIIVGYLYIVSLFYIISGKSTKKFRWIIDWLYKGFLSGSSWSLYSLSSSPLIVNSFYPHIFLSVCKQPSQPNERNFRLSQNTDQTWVDGENPTAAASEIPANPMTWVFIYHLFSFFIRYTGPYSN